MPLRFVLEGIAEVIFDFLFDLFEEVIDFFLEKVFRKKSDRFGKTTSRRRRIPLKSQLKVYQLDEVDTPAQIIEQPAPLVDKTSVRNRKAGVVRLKAILGRDGKVKFIQPLQGLDNKLTKAATQAARQIRFHPAKRGGFPVSQWIEMEYPFEGEES